LSLPIIGKLLGHTQASTTQRYAHLDSDPLQKASNEIGHSIALQMGDSRRENPRNRLRLNLTSLDSPVLLTTYSFCQKSCRSG
jgi:hypothetical protein